MTTYKEKVEEVLNNLSSRLSPEYSFYIDVARKEIQQIYEDDWLEDLLEEMPDWFAIIKRIDSETMDYVVTEYKCMVWYDYSIKETPREALLALRDKLTNT